MLEAAQPALATSAACVAAPKAEFRLLVSDVNTCAEVTRYLPEDPGQVATEQLVVATDRATVQMELTATAGASPATGCSHDALWAVTYSGCVPQTLVTRATTRVALRAGDAEIVVWELGSGSE